MFGRRPARHCSRPSRPNPAGAPRSDAAEPWDEEESRFHQDTEHARRDLLCLYRSLCDRGRRYEDFGHGHGEFEPLRFIDLADDAGLGADATRLLREGSAVAVLCRLPQEASQGGDPQHRSAFIERVEEAWAPGRIASDRRLEDAVRTGPAAPPAPFQDAGARRHRQGPAMSRVSCATSPGAVGPARAGVPSPVSCRHRP